MNLWNGENIHILPCDYMSKVIENIRNRHGINSFVKFGLTGKGVEPNYQVIDYKGGVFTYNGRSHDFDINTELYSENNLSRKFSYDDLINRFVGERDYLVPVDESEAFKMMAAFYAANKKDYPNALGNKNDICLSLLNGEEIKRVFDKYGR